MDKVHKWYKTWSKRQCFSLENNKRINVTQFVLLEFTWYMPNVTIKIVSHFIFQYLVKVENTYLRQCAIPGSIHMQYTKGKNCKVKGHYFLDDLIEKNVYMFLYGEEGYTWITSVYFLKVFSRSLTKIFQYYIGPCETSLNISAHTSPDSIIFVYRCKCDLTDYFKLFFRKIIFKRQKK